MDKDYFMSNGVPFEPTMPWNSDCLFSPNWDHSLNPFDSIAPSPAELIGKISVATRYIGTNSLEMPNLGSCHPPLPDQGFAQRAAKFSCFGSRSFNGRTSPLGHRSAQQLPRVSSSPSLKQAGNNNPVDSVSDPSGETESKSPTRKRKAVCRGKTKQEATTGNLGGEVDDSARAKRCKTVEANEGPKSNEGDEKPPEPPKDYIHVRARRGQATDSHSLAERVRREKISERMKLLQDLVPGCNKVTGKALMLDEIINYVQSLQRQVEVTSKLCQMPSGISSNSFYFLQFLSMKLASVNPSLDICQPNPNATLLPQPVLPCYQQLHNNIPNGAPSKSSVNTLGVDSTICRTLGMQLPPLDAFTEYLNQFPTICEDDLQSIVQMGFSQNPNKEQGFPVPNSTSHMKIEM